MLGGQRVFVRETKGPMLKTLDNSRTYVEIDLWGKGVALRRESELLSRRPLGNQMSVKSKEFIPRQKPQPKDE